MSANARARRVVPRRKPESLDEWADMAKRGLPVTRGELLWWLDQVIPVPWYRKLWRTLTRFWRS